jgi:CRISPR-associated protein Csm1
MSVQILVQGRLFGAREFLLAPVPAHLDRARQEALVTGRSHWISLLAEVLPRALIAELELSRMLLGASGGEQFVVILPGETRPRAEEFLSAAREQIHAISGGRLDLLWGATESLGDWTVVRKRLNEAMLRRRSTPLAESGASFFDRTPLTGSADDDAYFIESLSLRLHDAQSVSWSPDQPARIQPGDGGRHVWPLSNTAAGAGADSIPLARQAALSDDGHAAASTLMLARRAQGRPAWGVLRGDVDDFAIRSRRAQSIEEHVTVSVLYKQFFAGELEVLCSMPEFWNKVSLLYCGEDDFAVYGAWDALIGLAREVQRVFERFAQEALKDLPGREGKTITMALELAPDDETTLASVFGRAGDGLAIAKASDKDCFCLLGRTLEWPQVADAAGLKDELIRMVTDFGIAPEYIRELCGIYRQTKKSGVARRPERPWRFHRRLSRILGSSRSRDFQRARTSLVTDLAGRNPANLKLRPSGRVALEWARLLTETPHTETMESAA